MNPPLYHCPPLHARLTEAACAANREQAQARDSMLHECRICPGVVALYQQGKAEPPRELPERVISPRNGMAEARRVPSANERMVATRRRNGKAKPSHWPARTRGVRR